MIRRINEISERRLERNTGPIVKSPMMLPASAPPQSFFCIDSIPPSSGKMERMTPMAAQMLTIDCSCWGVMVIFCAWNMD